jgi:oligoendopeptidase F
MATLAKALADYEAVAERITGKPLRYLGLARYLATDDKKIMAALSLATARYTKASNEVAFFTLALGKLPKGFQMRALKEKPVARYRHLLDGIFRAASHQLSEAEEKLTSLVAQPAESMWEAYTDARVSALTG